MSPRPRTGVRHAPSTALVLGGASDIAQVTLGRLVGLGLERAVVAVRDPAGIS